MSPWTRCLPAGARTVRLPHDYALLERVIGADVKPYTRRKHHADEVIARENAGPAPRKHRGQAVKSNRSLRRYQHKQARQEARSAARARITTNSDDSDGS